MSSRAASSMTPFPEGDLRLVLEATRPLWESLKGERILITGGTGFFGRWLLTTFAYANRELHLGARAVAVSRGVAGTKPAFRVEDPAIDWVSADVRATTSDQLPGRFAFIIHAATSASSRSHAEDPLGTFDTIVHGTRRMLELASTPEAGTRRLLFLSSGAVYGRQAPELNQVTEEALTAPNPCSPRSAYAEGKRTAELLCALYGRTDPAGASNAAAVSRARLEPVIARCFAFAGPGMPLDGPFAMGCFIRDAIQGRPIRIEGDGTPIRSYLYASDLCIWLWTLLFRGRALHPYHVGGEEALSIAELAKRVADVVGSGSEIVIAGKPAAGILPERYVPSIERVRMDLGLKPTVTLDQAIAKTAAWARSQS